MFIARLPAIELSRRKEKGVVLETPFLLCLHAVLWGIRRSDYGGKDHYVGRGDYQFIRRLYQVCKEVTFFDT